MLRDEQLERLATPAELRALNRVSDPGAKKIGFRSGIFGPGGNGRRRPGGLFPPFSPAWLRLPR